MPRKKRAAQIKMTRPGYLVKSKSVNHPRLSSIRELMNHAPSVNPPHAEQKTPYARYQTMRTAGFKRLERREVGDVQDQLYRIAKMTNMLTNSRYKKLPLSYRQTATIYKNTKPNSQFKSHRYNKVEKHIPKKRVPKV